MIDSHCHLTDPRLGQQLAAVLTRAKLSGIELLVTIGTSVSDSEASVLLCESHNETIRAVVGVHPNHCQDEAISLLDRVAELARHGHVVAVGETGLDYHYDRADRSRQRAFFERQIDIAIAVKKPLVVHCREAIDDALSILKNHPFVPGVFHCFTGSPDEVEKIVEAGYYVGFTGPITYKKNDDLREAAGRVPLDRLLVETDAPYLSPEPVRSQKICEPAFVAYTLARLAEVKGLSVEEADRITTANTRRLYQLD